MIVIGVTGSLASGKSAVTAILKKKGARVFDADVSARKITRKGTPVYKAILKLFGREYLKPGGEINRGKLASRVFSNSKDLDKLNTLIHPGVIVDCLNQIHGAKRRKGIFALDVPLLFESKMQNLADATITVSAKPAVLLARAKKKGVPEKLARKILSNQWTPAKKERLADYVIHNNGSKKELEKKVLQVLEKIKSTQTEGNQ